MTVLLFLGAAAWLGALLYDAAEGLRRQAIPAAAEAPSPLRGVAVRRERAVEPIPGGQDGKRLRGRGVYFAACDGYETLSPEMLASLDAETLDALLSRPPGEQASARIVEDTAWYYAALLAGGDAPEPGPCRLRFQGFEGAVQARLLSVREEGGRCLLVFRLTEGGDYLKLRFAEAEIEISG